MRGSKNGHGQPLWRAVLFMALLALVAVGCGTAQDTTADGTPSPGQAADDTPATDGTDEPAGEPFTIGVLAPETGPQASLGEDLINGVRLYFDENPTVAGREIRVLVEDTASDPQQGLSAARQLVEQDNVDMLFGMINSAVLASVQEYATDNEVPLMSTNASTMSFTAQDSEDPLRIRVSHTNSIPNLAMAWWAYSELDSRRVSTLTWDFLAGTEMQQFFTQQFTSLGGEVVQEQFTPLGTSDFAPLISNIDPDQIDHLWVFLAGPDAVQFMQQASEFGLTDRVTIISSFLLSDEVIPAIGEAGAGHYTALQYFCSLDTPENQDFIEAYEAAYDDTCTVYNAGSYTGGLVVAEGLKAVDGDTSDMEAFVSAMRGLELDTPMGPISFDQWGQAILNIYIAEIQEQDGRYVPVVTDTVESVDQFWEPPTS